MSTDIDFRTKYKEYGEMLYRIAFVYLGNPDDTEDILQEVFIALLYNSPEFKSKEHEKAWLIRITQNKCINFLKSTSRKNIPIDELKLPTYSENQEEKIDIIKNILSLPPKYKTTVILYYYNDYSVDEIAKILKISKSAVKMRLKRAREILKIELEDYHYEEK
ncbi:MAG: RNA polymerase sigma factor [Clostridia bacterium]|nr:RNA polymerase sigma factor [Clostridia bacterium]